MQLQSAALSCGCVGLPEFNIVISQIGVPQYRPQNTTVLILGTPKMVPLIWGNSHMRITTLKAQALEQFLLKQLFRSSRSD